MSHTVSISPQSTQRPKRAPEGLDRAVHRLMGRHARRRSRQRGLMQQADSAAKQAIELKSRGDAELAGELKRYREQARRRPDHFHPFAVPALAAIAEASRRKLGLQPFPVQLAGALSLLDGCLIEMATGEGKTLTAGLAAVMAGWTGRPCHIVTVNDYLVQRDANWLTPLYHFCGIRVGHVIGGMKPVDRRKAYGCDVTYVTAKELLADVLRDRLQQQASGNRQPRSLGLLKSIGRQLSGREILRGLHTAIVDEADSILIDEAVTPLIISAPRRNDMLTDAVQAAVALSKKLVRDVDYTCEERYREVELTESGQRKLESSGHTLGGIWSCRSRRNEIVRTALQAREYFHRGRQYLVQDEKVVIVDEFTGRPMPLRSWRQGLHQAVEAKEDLPLTNPSETLARQSYQGFFRTFPRLCGMTGTAYEAADEFWNVYQLPVIRIPTHRPCLRQVLPTRAFADGNSKWTAIVEEVRAVHQTGRPVLIGTRSVSASEHLSNLLQGTGIDHELLNANRLAEEASIIAMAGEPRRVTIATNMAGRGTDILLARGIAEKGGLHVIVSEPHESARVDRQLMGRCARQGDPGSARIYFSMEDELIRRYLPASLQSSVRRALSSKIPAAESLARAAMNRSQSRAQSLAFRRRQQVLKMDNWLEDSLAFTAPSPA